MIRWKYEISIHKLPPSPQKEEKIIRCDQAGQCFVHDASRAGTGWLENIFKERGEKGWELVQSGYHNQELLCIWKQREKAGAKR
jgi:hypothetical protein